MSATMPITRNTLLAIAGVDTLALAACDNGPSAVARKQAAGTQMATNTAPSVYADSPSASDNSSGYGSPQVDHRKEPVKLVGGKPMWSASRKSSANENAQRAFDRNGAAFGARDIDSFIGKAHAFVDHPPKGTLTMTRKNGDTLFYDPKGNIFAVASKEGAPRAMFKPDDGMAYWEQQKSRETRRQASRRNRDDDA